MPQPAPSVFSVASALLALLRPLQWVKNGFVAAPLLLTPDALSLEHGMAVLSGTIAFCLVASAVYVFNDLMDRETDRLHATKRSRPLAAGTVPVAAAVGLAFLLLLGAGILVSVLPLGFGIAAVLYLGINLAYSLRLKHVAIVDVILVALGFVLRVEAGGALVGIDPSAWIVIATGLLALFIALAKRRDDLVQDLRGDHRRSLDGYTKQFLDLSMTMVLGALLVAYLIYTTDAAVMARLGTTKIFYTAPFVVAGVLRYMQIALVEERSGSPTVLVTSDRFLIICIVGWLSLFLALIHG